MSCKILFQHKRNLHFTNIINCGVLLIFFNLSQSLTDLFVYVYYSGTRFSPDGSAHIPSKRIIIKQEYCRQLFRLKYNVLRLLDEVNRMHVRREFVLLFIVRTREFFGFGLDIRLLAFLSAGRRSFNHTFNHIQFILRHNWHIF